MTVFLLVLLAHVLADFVFQSEATALEKGKGKFSGFISHSFFVFLATTVFLLPYEGLNPFILALSVAGVHLLIDWLKYIMNRLFRKFGRNIAVASFLFDQVLHIVAILILTEGFVPVEKEFMWELQSRLPNLDLYLTTIIVYLYVVFGGIYFVRTVLDSIPSFHSRKWREEKASELIFQSREETNKGMFIGILERAMVLTLWITGNAGAIGFVLAAKSIARFKEFDDKEFAEYYLIGTLASMLLAVVGGIVLIFVYG